MKETEPQWDKIEYTSMDVLRGAVGQLKSEYMKKMLKADSEAEKKWWAAHSIGFDHLTGMVDPTNAAEIDELIDIISEKLEALKGESK